MGGLSWEPKSEGADMLLKRHNLRVLINGSGYAFSIIVVNGRGLVINRGDKTSISSMVTQTIQYYCK